MLRTPLPIATPFPVEVITQADPWLPYIPPAIGLFGSILVALVALYSLRKNNKTSERAIDTADKRERDRWEKDSEREHQRWKNDRESEREKWHRDNLMRLCSDALRVTREIQQHYVDAAAACKTTSDLAEAQQIFRVHMGAAQAAIDKVVPLHYEIDLLGESRVAFEFLEFREVAVFIEPAVEQFHNYLAVHFDRLNELDLHETLEWRRYYKASIHIDQAIRDFKSVAQQKISPDSVPNDAPAKEEPWLTPEKNPDLFYGRAGRRNSIYMSPSPFDWNAGDTAEAPIV